MPGPVTGRAAGSGGGGEDASATAAAHLPQDRSLPALREAAAGCRGCDLWRSGTQTVFGAGLRDVLEGGGDGEVRARLMLVGEQPGDREDRDGRPFVGPAGAELDRALERVGIDRAQAYVTNVVKHFKFKPRGKRRIHAKPNAEEITACRPWLDAELASVEPDVLVALGATAAQALFGRSFRVTRQRGQLMEWPGGPPWNPGGPPMTATATVHPSSILRAPDDERADARDAFVADLTAVAALLR